MSMHFIRSGRKSQTVSKLCTKVGARVVYIREAWTKINGVMTKVFDSGYVPPVIPDPEPEQPTIAGYLVVSYDGSIHYSADGLTFTRSSHLVNPGKHAVVYNPDDQYFYICDLEQTRANWVRTHDGIDFEAITGPETNIGAVCLANGFIVALENNSDKLHYAPTSNSQSWTAKQIMDLNSVVNQWESLIYCPVHGRWIGQIKSVTSGQMNYNGYIMFSAPTSEISALLLDFTRYGRIVEAGNKYYSMASVYVGERPNGYIERYLMGSTDGLDWDVELDLGQNVTATQTAPNDFVASNGAVTVTTATTSNNGINVNVAGVWSLYQIPMSIGSMNYPMAYINGVFVIAKADSQSTAGAYSVNGTDWMASTMISNSGCVSMIKAGRFAFFSSADGVVQNTSDGQTWNNISTLGGLYQPANVAIASSEV